MHYTWSIALYGAETWTLHKVDQQYLDSVEMWYWRRKERISCANSVRNEVPHREGVRNILQTIKRRTDNWIGQIMHGKCLLKHTTERKSEL
jgi:hypothetical protein